MNEQNQKESTKVSGGFIFPYLILVTIAIIIHTFICYIAGGFDTMVIGLQTTSSSLVIALPCVLLLDWFMIRFRLRKDKVE